MAWMICGTVPDASFPLTGGRWRLDGGFLHAEGGGIAPLSVQRGTPALLGTALLTCETLGVEPPTALLAGDIGNGDREPGSSTAALRPPPACPGCGASRFITCSQTLMGTTAS